MKPVKKDNNSSCDGMLRRLSDVVRESAASAAKKQAELLSLSKAIQEANLIKSAECDLHRQRLSECQADLVQARSETQQVTQENGGLKTALSNERDKCEAAAAACQVAESDAERVKREMEDLHLGLKEANKCLELAQTKCSSLRDQINELESSLEKEKGISSKLDAEKTSLAAQLRTANQNNQTLTARLAKRKENFKKTEQLYKNCQRDLIAAQELADELQLAQLDSPRCDSTSPLDSAAGDSVPKNPSTTSAVQTDGLLERWEEWLDILLAECDPQKDSIPGNSSASLRLIGKMRAELGETKRTIVEMESKEIDLLDRISQLEGVKAEVLTTGSQSVGDHGAGDALGSAKQLEALKDDFRIKCDELYNLQKVAARKEFKARSLEHDLKSSKTKYQKLDCKSKADAETFRLQIGKLQIDLDVALQQSKERKSSIDALNAKNLKLAQAIEAADRANEYYEISLKEKQNEIDQLRLLTGEGVAKQKWDSGSSFGGSRRSSTSQSHPSPSLSEISDNNPVSFASSGFAPLHGNPDNDGLAGVALSSEQYNNNYFQSGSKKRKSESCATLAGEGNGGPVVSVINCANCDRLQSQVQMLLDQNKRQVFDRGIRDRELIDLREKLELSRMDAAVGQRGCQQQTSGFSGWHV